MKISLTAVDADDTEKILHTGTASDFPNIPPLRPLVSLVPTFAFIQELELFCGLSQKRLLLAAAEYLSFFHGTIATANAME